MLCFVCSLGDMVLWCSGFLLLRCSLVLCSAPSPGPPPEVVPRIARNPFPSRAAGGPSSARPCGQITSPPNRRKHNYSSPPAVGTGALHRGHAGSSSMTLPTERGPPDSLACMHFWHLLSTAVSSRLRRRKKMPHHQTRQLTVRVLHLLSLHRIHIVSLVGEAGH